MEREIRDPSSYPEHLREYLDNSPFTVSRFALDDGFKKLMVQSFKTRLAKKKSP